jgi:hypothetical protein
MMCLRPRLRRPPPVRCGPTALASRLGVPGGESPPPLSSSCEAVADRREDSTAAVFGRRAVIAVT